MSGRIISIKFPPIKLLQLKLLLLSLLTAPPYCLADDINQQFNQANLQIKNKHLLEGRRRLKILCDRPDATPDMYCEYAETFLEIESVDEDTPAGVAAMQGLQTALKKDPGSGRAYKDLALLANMHGQPALAVQYATKSLASKHLAKEAWRQRSLAYSRLGRMADALKDIDEFIKQGNTSSISYMLRGDYLQALKRYSEAASSYRQAMAADNKYQDRSFNQLIKVLQLDGKTAEAITVISARIAKDPSDAEMIDMRGQFEVKEKKLQEALRDFSAAIAADPRSLYYDHRAALYASLGQTKLAADDRVKAKKEFHQDF